MDFAASIDRLIAHGLASARAQLGAVSDHTTPPPAAPVDIFVPVHDAYDEVERCIGALRAYTDERHRIILIDDASPDPRKSSATDLSRVRAEPFRCRNEDRTLSVQAALFEPGARLAQQGGR